MREIIDHIVAGDAANHQLKVMALDGPGSGNVSHDYVLSHGHDQLNRIQFQNGPIKESGVNGVTGEALLAILIDRLRGSQSGPYACRENQNQLDHLEKALYWAQNRTRQRIARGVEGTHEK